MLTSEASLETERLLAGTVTAQLRTVLDAQQSRWSSHAQEYALEGCMQCIKWILGQKSSSGPMSC